MGLGSGLEVICVNISLLTYYFLKIVHMHQFGYPTNAIMCSCLSLIVHKNRISIHFYDSDLIEYLWFWLTNSWEFLYIPDGT